MPASLDVSSGFWSCGSPSCFYSHGYSQLIHRHWLQLWVLNCRLRRADFLHTWRRNSDHWKIPVPHCFEIKYSDIYIQVFSHASGRPIAKTTFFSRMACQTHLWSSSNEPNASSNSSFVLCAPALKNVKRFHFSFKASIVNVSCL